MLTYERVFATECRLLNRSKDSHFQQHAVDAIKSMLLL